jgi:hypothetical protein
MRNEENENLRTERGKIEFEYIQQQQQPSSYNTIIIVIEAQEIIVIP